MSKNDGDIYIENQQLKKAFQKLNLPLDEIMELVPYNLEIENIRLKSLLDYTKQYLGHRSRKMMELSGQPFAPVFPSISPENDWLRFEKWINGESTIQKTKDRLPIGYKIIPATELSDEALAEEIDKLRKLLAQTGFYIDSMNDIPKRLKYKMILESLEEEDMMGEGWHSDGCDGYCPGCVQRPWCDSGQDLCWPEDEETGKIHFIEELNDYVSATPVSLDLLQECQRKYDEEMEAIKERRNNEIENSSNNNFELPQLGDELFDISSN